MNVFDTYIDLPDKVKGSIVLIGNFDGVHKGHQSLIKTARALADELGVACSVLTFDPHPRQFFKPENEPFRLTNTALKSDDLLKNGADFVVNINFDDNFSQKTATNFIQDVLVDNLNAAHIVVGDDFIFGHNRSGSIETLKADGRFKVTALSQVKTDSQAIYGSSLIRQALKIGDTKTAADHLGRFWTTQATVIHGNKRGREIGYPTANMKLNDQGDFIHPAYGVYAVRVKTNNGTWINGVANFGIRPMFEVPEPLLEAHLFNFDGDLYDKILTVEWVERLRGEMKFDNLDDLIVQMNGDSARAKEILAKL